MVFDAYGTLFDVHSVASLAEQLFPGKGDALSQLWRQKQLEYSWLRAMSGRYKPFWDVTRDALRFAAARLALGLAPELEVRLMNQYASLSAFPENLDALRALRDAGLPLGILSNGNREMIEVSVRSAGMSGLFEHLLSSQDVETFKTCAPIYALAPAVRVPRPRICSSRRTAGMRSRRWLAMPASGSIAPARRSSARRPDHRKPAHRRARRRPALSHRAGATRPQFANPVTIPATSPETIP